MIQFNFGSKNWIKCIIIYSKGQRCSCKDLAVCNYTLATIGDDCKLNVISLNTKQIHQVLGKLIYCIVCIKYIDINCYMFFNDLKIIIFDKYLHIIWMFDYLEGISSSPLTCICFLTDTEVLCCNSLSQMKLWDLRVAKSSITDNINNFTQVILILIMSYFAKNIYTNGF